MQECLPVSNTSMQRVCDVCVCVCIEQQLLPATAPAKRKRAYRKTMKLQTYSISPFSVNEQKKGEQENNNKRYSLQLLQQNR